MRVCVFLRCVAFRLPFSLLPREEEDNEKEEKKRQKTQRQATPFVGFSVSSSSRLSFFLRLSDEKKEEDNTPGPSADTEDIQEQPQQ